MLHPFKIALIVALAVTTTYPQAAMAGGFKLFRHCRAKQQTCCPPPVCVPCPPVACPPVACPPVACPPVSGAAVAEPVPPVADECWIGIVSGIKADGTPCTCQGPCVPNATDALYAAYQACTTCTPYSISVVRCSCPAPEPNDQGGTENRSADGPYPEPPGQWWGHVIVRQGITGQRRTRRNPAALRPGGARKAAAGLAGSDSIDGYLFIPLTPDRE